MGDAKVWDRVVDRPRCGSKPPPVFQYARTRRCRGCDAHMTLGAHAEAAAAKHGRSRPTAGSRPPLRRRVRSPSACASWSRCHLVCLPPYTQACCRPCSQLASASVPKVSLYSIFAVVFITYHILLVINVRLFSSHELSPSKTPSPTHWWDLATPAFSVLTLYFLKSKLPAIFSLTTTTIVMRDLIITTAILHCHLRTPVAMALLHIFNYILFSHLNSHFRYKNSKFLPFARRVKCTERD